MSGGKDNVATYIENGKTPRLRGLAVVLDLGVILGFSTP